MRLNQYLAAASGLSRRKADDAIHLGRVLINDVPAKLGARVEPEDVVKLDGQVVKIAAGLTLILNKPAGYVCSRNGQGSQTIYDLLPAKYHALKPAGRLDKDSSGLLILTNDGQLAQSLTHPSYAKTKIYLVTLNKLLAPLHQQMISDHGIQLDDGPSRLGLQKLSDDAASWQITMSEGRNRQIRRTFAALGYSVVTLHRTNFGNHSLGNLGQGDFLICP